MTKHFMGTSSAAMNVLSRSYGHATGVYQSVQINELVR